MDPPTKQPPTQAQPVKPINQSSKSTNQSVNQSVSFFKSALKVLSLAVALPIVFVVAFVVSPSVQNAAIFMHPFNWPPYWLIDFTHPEKSQLNGFIPPLMCSSYVKTDAQSYNMSFHQSNSAPIALGGWHLQPEIRCQQKGTGPDDWIDQQAERCWRSKPFDRTILYLHGNGGNRAFTRSYHRYHMLTRFPFCADVFVFDYRGFAENSGVPTQSALIDDVIEMYAYIVKTYNVTSLDVYGHSLGSALATHALERLINQSDIPFLTRHLVLEGAIASIIEPVLSHLPEPLASNQWVHTFLESRLDTKLESAHALSTIASRVPTILVHGKKDTKVEISNSERLWNVLVNSTNEPVESIRSQGGVIHSAKPHAFVVVDAGDHSNSVHNNLVGRVTVSKFLYDKQP